VLAPPTDEIGANALSAHELDVDRAEDPPAARPRGAGAGPMEVVTKDLAQSQQRVDVLGGRRAPRDATAADELHPCSRGRRRPIEAQRDEARRSSHDGSIRHGSPCARRREFDGRGGVVRVARATQVAIVVIVILQWTP
jgi:hypothetical protein